MLPRRVFAEVAARLIKGNARGRRMKINIQGNEYWPPLEEKLKAVGLEVRERAVDFDTRNFRPEVSLIDGNREETLVLLDTWLSGWIKGNDSASEASIDAAIRQTLQSLRSPD